MEGRRGGRERERWKNKGSECQREGGRQKAGGGRQKAGGGGSKPREGETKIQRLTRRHRPGRSTKRPGCSSRWRRRRRLDGCAAASRSPRCPRALRAPRAPPAARAPPASAAPASQRPLEAAANKGGLVCSPAAAASPGAVLRAAPWSPVQPWPASAPGPPAVPPRPPSWGRARGRGRGCRQHPGWTPGARPGSARTHLTLAPCKLIDGAARTDRCAGDGGSAEGPRATGTVKNKVSALQCVRPTLCLASRQGSTEHTRDHPGRGPPRATRSLRCG